MQRRTLFKKDVFGFAFVSIIQQYSTSWYPLLHEDETYGKTGSSDNRKPLVVGLAGSKKNSSLHSGSDREQLHNSISRQIVRRLVWVEYGWRFWTAWNWLSTSNSRNEAAGEGSEGNASVFSCSRLEELFWLARRTAEAPHLPLVTN